jgi:hypothetical protein
MPRLECGDFFEFFFYQLYNPTYEGFSHMFGLFEKIGCFG